MYSLVQWNWFSDVTGCTWVTCIQWCQRTNFIAPGCIDRKSYLILQMSLRVSRSEWSLFRIRTVVGGLRNLSHYTRWWWGWAVWVIALIIIGFGGSRWLCIITVFVTHPGGNKKRAKTYICEPFFWIGPVCVRHRAHLFAIQSSHSMDLAGWQAKMASIGVCIPWRNAHKPHSCTSMRHAML